MSNAHDRDSDLYMDCRLREGKWLLDRLSTLSIDSNGNSNVVVEHPNAQSYAMILDALNEQGLGDEAQAIFDEMLRIFYIDEMTAEIPGLKV